MQIRHIRAAGLDSRFAVARLVVLLADNRLGRKLVNSRKWAAGWTSSRHRKEMYRLRFNIGRSQTVYQPSTLTLPEWLFLVTLYGYRCAFCGCGLSAKKTSMEHLVPISLGGGTVLANVVPCCKFCNCARDQLVR